MTTRLLRRRPKCPSAPTPVIRTGDVCHCGALNHAVSDDARLSTEAELLLARLNGNADLVVALKMRLLPCPSAGPSAVTL